MSFHEMLFVLTNLFQSLTIVLLNQYLHIRLYVLYNLRLYVFYNDALFRYYLIMCNALSPSISLKKKKQTNISPRPRSAEYTIGICFETAKKTKAFECFFTGFQHSL